MVWKKIRTTVSSFFILFSVSIWSTPVISFICGKIRYYGIWHLVIRPQWNIWKYLQWGMYHDSFNTSFWYFKKNARAFYIHSFQLLGVILRVVSSYFLILTWCRSNDFLIRNSCESYQLFIDYNRNPLHSIWHFIQYWRGYKLVNLIRCVVCIYLLIRPCELKWWCFSHSQPNDDQIKHLFFMNFMPLSL